MMLNTFAYILPFVSGYEIEGMENIPDTGPALIIYYHGVVPLDFYYVVARVNLDKRRQIRAVGDRFLFHIPGMTLIDLSNMFALGIAT